MTSIGLRERKYAATKAALMNAVINRLGTHSLAEIVINEICDEVQVSETTFYNYFPSKQSVIIYFVQLWSIEMGFKVHALRLQGGTHLGAIHHIFETTARKLQQRPGIMGEIVAYQAHARNQITFAPITPAEYALHFADYAEFEPRPARGLEDILAEQLRAAVRAGELPADSDVPTLLLTLLAIFFMTPILVSRGQATALWPALRKQLDQLLSGAGAGRG